MDSAQALEKLRQGNLRYLNALSNPADISPQRRRTTALEGQEPYAVVVTCSDSRVAPEHIFLAGNGELFVIRTAGALAGAHESASAQYAVRHLGCRLILVMGHTGCGAVAGAFAGQEEEGPLGELLGGIRAGIEGAKSIPEAEEASVIRSARNLASNEGLSKFVASGELAIVCARYVTGTGEVLFGEKVTAG